MEEEKLFEVIAAAEGLREQQRVLAVNEKTEGFGLSLTEEEARMLVRERRRTLKEERRVEFGEGILTQLIMTFCDSAYLERDGYAGMLARLQEIFYRYKNEAQERLTDGELLTLMRELFDGVCCGSAEYLEETCLERFARAVRAGYMKDGRQRVEGSYEQFSEEEGWNRELYLCALYAQMS